MSDSKELSAQRDWTSIPIMAASIIIPAIGAYLFARTGNEAWLTLMVAVFIWLEGAFVLGPALIVLAYVVVWLTS